MSKRMLAYIVVTIGISIIVVFFLWRNNQERVENEFRQTAEVKVPKSGNVLLVPIGLDTHGGLFTPLFDEGTPLPQTQEQIYTTTNDSQREVDVRLLQGFRPLAANNEVLAELKITGLPLLPRGVPQIKISFHINAEGILSVSAMEVSSGQFAQIVTVSKSELTDEEIEILKRDAEKYAKEDAQEASLIQTQYQAELMAYVAREHVLTMTQDESDVASLKKYIEELELVKTDFNEPAILSKMETLQSEMERISGMFYDRNRGIFEP